MAVNELPLHLEVVLDEGLDDLVDAGIGGKAERFGTRRVQRLWPAGYDLLDLRIGLLADARISIGSCGATHRSRYVADRDREAGQLLRGIGNYPRRKPL